MQKRHSSPFYWTSHLLLNRFYTLVQECVKYNQWGALRVDYAEMAVEGYCEHLRGHGVDLSEVVFQTDCGAEFSGTSTEKG
jgi:hypothetical protein